MILVFNWINIQTTLKILDHVHEQT